MDDWANTTWRGKALRKLLSDRRSPDIRRWLPFLLVCIGWVYGYAVLTNNVKHLQQDVAELTQQVWELERQ